MITTPRSRPPSVVVEVVRPVVDGGTFPAKVTTGEDVVVAADVFAAGHVVVDAALRWRAVSPAGGRGPWSEVPMTTEANDRFTASFRPDRLGRWEIDVQGWVDHAETWRRGTALKVAAGVDVSLELRDGRRIIADLIETALPADAAALRELLDALERGDTELLDHPSWTGILWRAGRRDPVARSGPFRLDVDPLIGRFSSWYEFFPRSAVLPNGGQQTLLDAVDRLDRVAAMGFDVVYIPPIHPIGTTKRKGRNNSTVATTDDVGSPWAIGAAAGGHDAVDPALGTVDDVVALAKECHQRGLHLALDVAFQCSPDHPWVTEHPTWFAHRADGSIQFAENPPKQYQDIYPLDFESDDWAELWSALVDVFRFWIDCGVTVFRVDNPHTKALPFWEWALRALHTEHPETVFLAEAFTRPRVMERLAKIGFNQSYTYFAWRQSSWELREYFSDLATRTVDYFRPNAWPNTPDILTEQLQEGGRAGFASRAVLAATLSPSWGVYGPAFELQEAAAAKPGSEEYGDSEKYQLREWDLDRPDSLEPLLTRLNEIRAGQPALQHLRTTWFHQTDNDALLCFSKTDPAGDGNPVVVVANLDHHQRQTGFVDLDLAQLGLPYGASYDVVDLLGGATYRWHANRNYVDLAPWSANAHVFEVRSTHASESAA